MRVQIRKGHCYSLRTYDRLARSNVRKTKKKTRLKKNLRKRVSSSGTLVNSIRTAKNMVLSTY